MHSKHGGGAKSCVNLHKGSSTKTLVPLHLHPSHPLHACPQPPPNPDATSAAAAGPSMALLLVLALLQRLDCILQLLPRVHRNLAQKVQHLLIEIVFGRRLPAHARHDSHIKDLDYIGAIRGGHEEERQLALGCKVETLRGDLVVDVNLVRDDDSGNAFAMFLQLVIPFLQVLVRHLARDVKDHNARVRTVVIRGVHAVEALLAGSVPDIYANVPFLQHNLKRAGGRVIRGEYRVIGSMWPRL
ncbi:hypothetical protein Vafri_3178 [Volvox africanus]|uniref:Uncharacterized protein n=1 Tax=Volvox africanus TaxID=51714 RepID=A0A8J4EW31_9CHLO|nr:hypothetical protein Vafri_3178 [Volvox africanus]